jgi:hypothetical protein
VILLKSTKDKFIFRMGNGEKTLLMSILELYPRVTSAQILASRSGRPPGKDDQETKALLEEALTEQRQQNKKTLRGFLTDPKRFEKQEAGWRFAVTMAEVDWLLQILNDVRVGSWIMMGSPENYLEVPTKKNEKDFLAMELAGRFEAVFLAALEGHGS